jgi:hypothetical protein
MTPTQRGRGGIAIGYMLATALPLISLFLFLYHEDTARWLQISFLIIFFGLFNYVMIKVIRNPDIRLRGFYFLSMVVASILILYADVYAELGLLQGEDIVQDRWDFLYFSIVTWTTLGYGDLRPSPASRLFAASEALLGYITMGLYIGLVFQAVLSRASEGPVSATRSPIA